VALTALLAVLLPATAAALPDGRGWEMVSPVDKNGGAIAAAGEIANGGVLQAAADGNSVTYGSATSFATDTESAPPGSQYLSRRDSAGWSTENLNVPTFAGSYGADPDGVPYQLFSPDLARGLLLNGRHCRSVEGACPVANPPLPGTDAPTGYQNYYLLRQGIGFEALLGGGDVASSDLGPADFDLRLAGAAPDLEHVVLESCAALVPGAGEVALGEGCDPTKQNLYEWSAAGGLSLVNASPGAALAASAGAISTDGSRVYFTEEPSPGETNLYLREGAQTKQVDAAPAVGGGGTFETASVDGSIAYFTKGGHLYRYQASDGATADLTPAGEVAGVLGASDDGSHVYYLAAAGLFHWSAGTSTELPTPVKDATAADPSDYPPATGTARVSPDGTRLVFLSSASLTGYNNVDSKTGLPDSEVFLYDAGANQLRCVSCRPSGSRPIGSSTIPGAVANGQEAGALAAYKPRVLSASGKRVFFDSGDSLAAADVNHEPDVYQWEAAGPGCAKPNGCIELISSGRSEDGARFVDASTSGDDVFFTTDESLIFTDPGSVDLYDARVGGGFPQPQPPIPCFGDSCEDLPSETVDPALGTLQSGPGNPKKRYFKYRRHKASCRGKAKSGGKAKKRAKCHKHRKARGAKGGRR
jgi:hypothetical protein